MDKDNTYKKHILDAIAQVGSFIEGFDYERFAEDKKTLDAVVREIEIIGEAAKKLSEEFKKDHPGIPWKDIMGMRDKLIHDYFSVDEEMVWEVATKDLRELDQQLR